MQTVVVKRRIKAPAEEVFERLTDHAGYGRFPGIRWARRVRTGHPEPNGTGALRVVDGGVFRFHEEITGFDRPHRMNYRIVKAWPPAEHQGGRIELQPQGQSTEVVWTSTFSAPWPVIGGVSERVLARIVRLIFTGILRHVERELTGA